MNLTLQSYYQETEKDKITIYNLILYIYYLFKPCNCNHLGELNLIIIQLKQAEDFL